MAQVPYRPTIANHVCSDPKVPATGGPVMALRTRLTALFIAGFAATMLVAADTPPKHLKLVGDHWTAWDPPSEFPEGTKVHIVVAGDTLWDLAAAHLGNPYLWPQIWEKNPYVLDAHWI